jgi:hypothetical protein
VRGVVTGRIPALPADPRASVRASVSPHYLHFGGNTLGPGKMTASGFAARLRIESRCGDTSGSVSGSPSAVGLGSFCASGRRIVALRARWPSCRHGRAPLFVRADFSGWGIPSPLVLAQGNGDDVANHGQLAGLRWLGVVQPGERDSTRTIEGTYVTLK